MDFHKKNRSSRLSSYHEYIFINEELDYIPAEGPGVARGKKKIWKKIKDLEKNWNFLAYVSPRLPMSVHKNFSPFGPAVVLYYYIDLPTTVYIQHSERQQLGLERRFFKYSEIQGEREKMAN